MKWQRHWFTHLYVPCNWVLYIIFVVTNNVSTFLNPRICKVLGRFLTRSAYFGNEIIYCQWHNVVQMRNVKQPKREVSRGLGRKNIAGSDTHDDNLHRRALLVLLGAFDWTECFSSFAFNIKKLQDISKKSQQGQEIRTYFVSHMYRIFALTWWLMYKFERIKCRARFNVSYQGYRHLPAEWDIWKMKMKHKIIWCISSNRSLSHSKTVSVLCLTPCFSNIISSIFCRKQIR